MNRSNSVASTSSSQAQNGGNGTGNNRYASPGSISTLAEAAAAFENVSQRANRCTLQIATFKAHEQQIRRFLLERALPAAEQAAKDREYVSSRHEEDFGNALLRLKGVNVSPTRGSPVTRRGNNGESVRVTDVDPQLGVFLDTLRNLSDRYNKPSYK